MPSLSRSNLLKMALSVAFVGALALFWHAQVRGPDTISPNIVSTPATPNLKANQMPTADPQPELISPTAPVTAREAFLSWAETYQTAPETQKPSLLSEGTRLANAHRETLLGLIRNDPRLALENAIPMVVRQGLPQAIDLLLEERINQKGRFEVLGVAAEGRAVPAIRRRAKFSDRSLEAHVYGWRAAQRTTEEASLVGVAVAGHLAVDESPLRALEEGEIPDKAKKISESCPVSGKTTPVKRTEAGDLPAISAETPAIEVGDEIRFLCHGGHIRVARDGMIAQEGSTGGAAKPTGTIPSSWTTGPRRVLYIRAVFPDVPDDPQSERDSYSMMNDVSNFIAENSFGKCYFLTTVTPVIMMPRTDAHYRFVDTDGQADEILSDARSAARAAGYDYSQYDLYAVRYNGTGGFSGQGYVGAAGVWLKNNNAGVAIHEFGHNLGLWHANFWNASGQSGIGAGTNSEYGHSYDTMGLASGGSNHFNSNHRNDLSWLPTTQLTTVRTNGTYRVYQMDQRNAEPGKSYALEVAKDGQRSYWGEFRQRFTTNSWMSNGLLLHWGAWGDSATDNTAAGSNGGAQLLDTTPGSSDSKDDAAIVVGRTFSDFDADLHITTVAKNATTPPSLDVTVNRGPFPANQSPSFTMEAPVLTADTNASLIFTANATDPDGDALAYYWTFGDRSFGTNAATVTKSWPTAGHYVVRCQVSDMKGKTVIRQVMVTIGTPSASSVTLTGTVRDASNAPMANVHVSNGATGSSYRGNYTDSDGNYIVTNLATGATVSAALYGYNFASVGQDFTATALASISLTAADASASESPGDTGSFLLTRTGSTSVSVTVRCQLTGSAGTSDYALSPTATASLGQSTFTIAAGQSSLAIAVTPSNDTTAEGPEMLRMTLLPTTSYVVASPAAAEIEIVDNDTSLPVVSLLAGKKGAAESGDPVEFAIHRQVATSSSLTVNFSVSGTGVIAADFSALPTSATIPADATETTVSIMPTDDSTAEGVETATFTLTNNAAYLRSASATSAAFDIADNDLPIVTVTLTDSVAAENGSNPGVFTFTRSGPTTAALPVQYAIGGTAMQGIDYLPLTGTTSIPAGQASVDIPLTPMDDAIGEPVQTVSLTLRSENSYLIGAAATASLNIVDNDLPMVSVRVSDGTCNESGDNGVFQIHSSSSETGNVTVSYTITPLDANGVQFTTLTGSVSVTKNNGSASVSVVPIADSFIEDALPVTITLTDSSNYVISTESTATIHLADDDGGNVVSISKESRSVTEGSTARFVLSRAGSTSDSLTVNLLWSGTAAAGADFASPGDSVIFGAGVNYLSIDVPTSNDGVVEGYETLMPMVAPGTGYTARIASASTYLLDANSASYNRTVGFPASTSTVAETAGSADISVSLSGTTTGPVSVLYRINGGTATGGGVDYQLGEGILTIPAGQTTGAISLPVIDDLFVETNETVIVILESSTGAKFGTTTHTVTITSNDAGPNPQISFAQASSAAAEAASSIVVPVNLAPPQTFAITVDYATSSITASDGLDFTGTSGTLTFAPGETQKTISIPLLNDTIQESSESFAVTLTNPVPVTATLITPSTHTATILDDDTSTVSITAVDSTAGEAGPDPAVVSISRTGGTDGNLTVTYQLSGTATNGTDYALLPGSFTIPAGQASADLTILPIDDAVSESLETVNITLTAGQSPGYLLGTTNRSVEITIADNENSAPTISLQSPVGGLVRLPALHQGLVLRATATDDGLPAGSTLSAVWSQASGPGGVEFSAPSSMETTAHFSAPGRYQLNLAVTDGSQSSTQSVVVDVEPIALDSLDVGNASTRPGSISESNGTYTLTGSGTNLGTNDTTDGHFFVWRPMGGNFEIQTRLASIGAGAGANSRCGITMRSSSANNARHATMAATPTRVSFSYRLNDATSSSASTTNVNSGITPRWFKLVKNGNVVSAFQSLDGTTWTQQGANQTFGTSADIWMVGLEVNSGSTTSSTTATFDSLQFHSANLAPSVNAGSDLSVAISNTASLLGTVTDTMPVALIHQWSAPSHATGVVFGNTSSASTTVAFASTGSHRLRLTATDGISETFDELEATVLAPPTVSITTQGPAGEFGPVVGQLTFHRTGATAEELSLLYTLAGSAAAGLDYASPGIVTIPAGSSQISLSVLPLADAINEGTETIEVSIALETHYTLGSEASATLLLHDLPFADWKSANFGMNANDTSQSGDASDPDFDGIDNLMEYGLALDPLIPATSLLPSSGLDATGLWLRFRKNTAALDLTYTPEWSVDHQNWETTGIQQETVPESSPVPEIKAILPLNGSEMRRIMRVRIAK